MPPHIFISNLDEGAEATLSKAADDIKPEVADTTEDCGVIQRDLTGWRNGLTETSVNKTKCSAKP